MGLKSHFEFHGIQNVFSFFVLFRLVQVGFCFLKRHKGKIAVIVQLV